MVVVVLVVVVVIVVVIVVPLVVSTKGITPNKLHESLELLFKPNSTHSYEESSGNECMLHSQSVFGRTVNMKCLVSGTGTVLCDSEYEVLGQWERYCTV